MQRVRIIYTEGASDQAILESWIKLHFAALDGYQVVALGGCGKVNEEFVKPLFRAYRDRIFILLDSDRSQKDETCSKDIARLVKWFNENDIRNHYVLQRREIENYIGPDAIAAKAGMHPSSLRASDGSDDWHDIKAAFRRHRGFDYDERRTSVGAFKALSAEQQRNLFGSENEPILERLRAFLLGVCPTG